MGVGVRVVKPHVDSHPAGIVSPGPGAEELAVDQDLAMRSAAGRIDVAIAVEIEGRCVEGWRQAVGEGGNSRVEEVDGLSRCESETEGQDEKQ
jgi:hypothetical protein